MNTDLHTVLDMLVEDSGATWQTVPSKHVALSRNAYTITVSSRQQAAKFITLLSTYSVNKFTRVDNEDGSAFFFIPKGQTVPAPSPELLYAHNHYREQFKPRSARIIK